MHRGRALAGVELASLGQRAFRLLRRRTLKQRVNFVVGPMILGRCGLWKAMEQSHCGGDVVACSSKVRKGFIVGDDPLVHVTGHGACAPTVSTAFDLPIDLHVLPNKLLSGFIYLLLSGSQLVHPYMRWGHCPPFGSTAKVAYRSSLLCGDAFDTSPRGFRHETFPGGVMAPPTRVRARVRP